MAQKFKVGDQVELLSGGPEMTVEGYDDEITPEGIFRISETKVKTTWFDNKNELKRAVLHQDVLKKAEE